MIRKGKRNFSALFLLLIVVATIIVYQPALTGGFIWDDDDYIIKNPLLTAPDGLRKIWFSLEAPSQYFPLVYTTFRIERMFWGLNPVGYHWVNIFLHIANALLVCRLLIGLKVPGAFLAALIFALHPVQVESVAWITERKNVLMGFFFLLTLLAWIAFVDERTKHRWRFYWLALGLYVLALSAKATACTLPAALLLILWLQRKPINWQRIFQLAPFCALGLTMGLVVLWWERYHQGTHGALFVLGSVERLLVASRAVWFYLGKLFWPVKLTFIYPQWNIIATNLLAYGWLLAGVCLCVVVYFLRRFFGRSIEVAAAFFIVTLSPLLGFIMLYTFRYTYVADHYQYLASIGPIALASAGLIRLGEFVKIGRQLTAVVSFLIVASLAVLTWRQSAMYSDLETLWRTTLAKNPGCWMAYNNLGIALFEKGQVDEAIPQYERSLQLHSDYAQAHYNLGNALLQKRKIDEAIMHCRSALALQPNDADAHVALGNALLAKGAVEDAVTQYAKAVQLRPGDSYAYYNLGHALQQKGQMDEAMVEYEKALRLQPNLMEAHLNMGNVLLEKKRDREAIAHYEKALTISPDSGKAQTSLAWALASSSERSLRNGRRAIELAEKASRFSHAQDPTNLYVLAAAYAENQQFDRALKTAQQALQFATVQNESELADEIRRVIKLYQAGSVYREP